MGNLREYSACELLPLLRLHGRTFLDRETGALLFNWTCSGFTVTFTGSVLRVRLLALGDRLPFPPDAPLDLPCVGLEQGGGLLWREKCREGEAWYEVFSGSQGRHTVRLTKLSENARGKAGLLALAVDGEVLDCDEPSPGLSLEFVGDSITCGYGNEAPGRDSPFDTAEENGWAAFGAVAARELGAEYAMVSVSGISVSSPERPMFPSEPMDTVYEYLDAPFDRRRGAQPRPWDFAGHRRDAVVLNLGTNDVNPIRFCGDTAQADREEKHFRLRYRAFLEKLRALNGPDTLICCVLGPLDYYLFDAIRDTVEEYAAGTGDRKIACFKLIGVNLMTEGWGADGHPSSATHLRMGRELAERLRALLPEKSGDK